MLTSTKFIKFDDINIILLIIIIIVEPRPMKCLSSDIHVFPQTLEKMPGLHFDQASEVSFHIILMSSFADHPDIRHYII
jgi:hypothetical protein